MRYSKKAIELIKKTRKMLYKRETLWNERQYIGYSHLICAIDSTRELTNISKKDAIKLLEKDLYRISLKLEAHLEKDVNQNQFDALVSLIYDIGFRSFVSSGILDLLNKQQYATVGLLFPRYARYKKKVVYRLAKARKEESKLFKESLK